MSAPVYGTYDSTDGYSGPAVWFKFPEAMPAVATRLMGPLAPGQCWVVHHWHVIKHTNAKWCERFTGWACDQEGEPHTHWELLTPISNVRPATHSVMFPGVEPACAGVSS